MRALFLAVLLALPALPVRAASRLAGADFLNQIQDVRVLGMGEAGAAAASGVQGLTVNPAAVHDVASQEAYFTHSLLGNGVGSDYAAWGLSHGVHRVALDLLHVGYGTLDGRDDAGNATGGFTPSADAYALVYGTTLGPLQVAAAGKYVQSKIVSTARTQCLDVGARWRLDDEWTLGLSGENLGGSLKFDQVSDPLPARLDGGAAWRLGDSWTVALDLVGPLYAPTYAALGGEYRLRAGDGVGVAFRAGLNTRNPDAGNFAGLKAGLGVSYRAVSIDYAFGPGAAVGDQHLFALTWRFGTPPGGQGLGDR